MNYKWPLVLALGISSLVPALALAHHSVTAEFDPSKTLTMKGTISGIDWVNPHVYLFVDVKDQNGNTTSWSLESYPPSVLKRGGMSRARLETGQAVTIDVFPAKDGSKALGFLKHITFSDGQSVEIWIGDPSQVK